MTDKGKRPDDKPEVGDSSQESKNQSGKVGGDRGDGSDRKDENASEEDEIVEEFRQMSEGGKPAARSSTIWAIKMGRYRKAARKRAFAAKSSCH